MSKRIEYTTKDGKRLAGEIGEPAGDAKAPALVVIQEWHGVNDQMKGKVDAFAKAGFLAFAPDLYHGKLAKDDAEAGALMNALDKQQAVAEIGNAAAWLREQPRSNGKVGVTGFCLGGGLALAAAVHVPGLSAVVPFYGLPGELDFSKITAPVQAHFAKHDDWATASGAEKIKQAIEKTGKTTMELFVYDAGHAFMRDTDASTHNEQAAKVAWDRAVTFLRNHVK